MNICTHNNNSRYRSLKGYCPMCLRIEVNELKRRLLLSESQNYCKMCGNTLDGYIPIEPSGKEVQ